MIKKALRSLLVIGYEKKTPSRLIQSPISKIFNLAFLSLKSTDSCLEF